MCRQRATPSTWLSFTSGDVFDRVLKLVAEVAASPSTRARTRKSGRFGTLPSEYATPLALALTELVTNAVEHGLARLGVGALPHRLLGICGQRAEGARCQESGRRHQPQPALHCTALHCTSSVQLTGGQGAPPGAYANCTATLDCGHRPPEGAELVSAYQGQSISDTLAPAGVSGSPRFLQIECSALPDSACRTSEEVPTPGWDLPSTSLVK